MDDSSEAPSYALLKMTEQNLPKPVQNRKQVPLHHSKPADSREDVSMASPSQSLAIQFETTTGFQVESIFAVKEHLHSHPVLETAGTFSESRPWSSSTSFIVGPTTLVVLNLPTRCTKEMLL